MLARDVDQWAADEITPLLSNAHDDVDGVCRALVKALGRAGLLRYCVPAAYGGHFEDLDVRALCLIRETLARHSGLADFAFAMQGLGSGAISLFGSRALKEACASRRRARREDRRLCAVGGKCGLRRRGAGDVVARRPGRL